MLRHSHAAFCSPSPFRLDFAAAPSSFAPPPSHLLFCPTPRAEREEQQRALNSGGGRVVLSAHVFLWGKGERRCGGTCRRRPAEPFSLITQTRVQGRRGTRARPCAGRALSLLCAASPLLFLFLSAAK